MTLPELQKEAHVRLAAELTHRQDGKKPSLHPNSLWNVKLLHIVDTLIASAYHAGKERAVGYIKSKGQYESPVHTLVFNDDLEAARNAE